MIAPLPNRRILVVDDNPAIHEDFRKVLHKPVAGDALDSLESAFFEGAAPAGESADFELDSAFQGEEGLAKVRQALDSGRPYSVAFVDMRMPPGWDGVETIEQFWKVDPQLQVVICTAYSDHSWDEIFGRLGNRNSLAVLKKPFDNVEVRQLAETLIQKWFLARQLLGYSQGAPDVTNE